MLVCDIFKKLFALVGCQTPHPFFSGPLFVRQFIHQVNTDVVIDTYMLVDFLIKGAADSFLNK
jgi:hypothetical protein